LDLFGSRWEMVSFCEYDNERLGCVKGSKFPKAVYDYCVCSNNSASWSYMCVCVCVCVCVYIYIYIYIYIYEGWNFNSGNYLFTTDTK